MIHILFVVVYLCITARLSPVDFSAVGFGDISSPNSGRIEILDVSRGVAGISLHT